MSGNVQPFRYMSVCSGIEAASVAWKSLGWECAGYSEIEPFPRAVLEQRLGAVAVDWDHRHAPGQNFAPLFGDFTRIESHHVGPVDLLVGGTPCQSFSIAGKRLGLDDPRGNLAIEFLALARRLGARWMVWENVCGVRSSWSGEPDDEAVTEWEETSDFAAFLDLFRECGYRGGWRTLDAQYVRVAGHERAVPQRRERVFVVGHIGDDARALPVLFEPESLRGHPAPRRQAGEGVAPTISARPSGGGGLGTDFDCDGGLIASQYDDGSVAAVTSKWAKGSGGPAGDECQNLVAHTLSAEGFDASEDGTGRGTPIIPIAFTSKDHGGDASYGVSPTLRSMGHDDSHANGGGQVAIALPERLSATQHASSFDVSPALGAVNPTAVAYSIMPMNSGKDYKARETDVAQPIMAGGPVGGNQGGDYIVQPVAGAICKDSFSGGAGGRPEGAAAGHFVPVAFQSRIARNGRGQPEEICPTLSGADAGATSDMRPLAAIPTTLGWAVRRLTPLECERLQGFPDGWTNIAWRGKASAPDGPRYKAIGNSMAVNVMRWLGQRIDMVEKIMIA